MEFFDFLLSLVGSFVVKAMNRAFGTTIKLGYAGQIVAGLFSLIFLIIIVFLLVRCLAVIGWTSSIFFNDANKA